MANAAGDLFGLGRWAEPQALLAQAKALGPAAPARSPWGWIGCSPTAGTLWRAYLEQVAEAAAWQGRLPDVRHAVPDGMML